MDSEGADPHWPYPLAPAPSPEVTRPPRPRLIYNELAGQGGAGGGAGGGGKCSWNAQGSGYGAMAPASGDTPHVRKDGRGMLVPGLAGGVAYERPKEVMAYLKGVRGKQVWAISHAHRAEGGLLLSCHRMHTEPRAMLL